MINNILARGGLPGPWELLVIVFVMFIVYGIPIFLVIWFARLLLRNKRENVRLRLEVGKLADELEQMRKKQGDEEKGSSDKSG